MQENRTFCLLKRLCKCGCGNPIELRYKNGNPKHSMYINGHNNYGRIRPHKEETKKKISLANKGHTGFWSKGKRFSEKHRRNIGLAEIGNKKWAGKHHTEKTKRIIASTKIGKRRSRESVKKQIASRMGYRHSFETRLKIRKSNLNKHYYQHRVYPAVNTIIERLLQDRLKELGIVFTTQKKIFGIPDIFIEPNICIFADGDYWHSLLKHILRDNKVNEYLTSNGYEVLRFWEYDIKHNINWCTKQILKKLDN